MAVPAPPPHEPEPTGADTGRGPAEAGGDGHGARPPVIDWGRTARRLRAVLSVIGLVVLGVWVAAALSREGLALPLLGELVGLGLLGAFVVEVVVVGGSAVRGMLTAGARGDRLSGDDVSLLPPQLGRRRRR